MDAAIATLAAAQHAVVPLAQLLAVGLSRSAIGKRVERGVLHRVHRGVYSVVPPRALSREGRWLAAVYATGEGAALSHVSAAQLHGITRRRAALIDVVVPRQRRPQRGIRVHRVRRLDPLDLTTERDIPVTSIARVLVDLSDVYLNGSAGVKSGPEVAFLALTRSAGLPDPLVNTLVQGFEVDFHWPDRMLAVEVDGDGHARPPVRREDALRDRILRAAGYTVLRFGDEDVNDRPGDVLRALGTGGLAVSSPAPRRAA